MSRIGLWGAVALAAVLGGREAQAQTPIPPSPKDFVAAAAQGDQYEMQAAAVAVVQGQDPRVRSFAETMIRDHTRLGDDVRQAAVAAGLPPPDPAMSSDQARLLGSLQSLRGSDFDKAYAAQQELAHTQAIAVAESFAAAGADPGLRTSAQSALPVMRNHLRMARELRAAVGR